MSLRTDGCGRKCTGNALVLREVLFDITGALEGSRGYSQVKPREVQLEQNGCSSLHLTFRCLHLVQPDRDLVCGRRWDESAVFWPVPSRSVVFVISCQSSDRQRDSDRACRRMLSNRWPQFYTFQNTTEGMVVHAKLNTYVLGSRRI